MLCKVPFKDRLDHIPQPRLCHPVPNRRDAQRALFSAARLGYPRPSYGLRVIRPLFQAFVQFLQVRRQVLHEHLDRHVIYARRTLVTVNLVHRRTQVRLSIDFVNQAEPFASSHPVFQGCQHTVCPDARFGPSPFLPDRSDLCSRFGHSRRWVFRTAGHPVSTFLCPFAPQALPCFIATMGTLTPARPALPSFGQRCRPLHLAGLPASHTRPLLPFRPQPPRRPCCRFITRPLSATGTPYRVQASPFYCRLAGRHGRIRFAYATDWRLTSCCFPPRLTTTQLQSVNGRSVSAIRGLSPL